MKPSERDNLLIEMAGTIGSLKEGVHNTYILAEKLERHNAIQNSQLVKVVESCNKNTVWRKIIIGVGTPGLIALISYLVICAQSAH